MFNTLFTYPAVIRRHCEGPLAAQRLSYIEALAEKRMSQGTLLRVARYCLCVAMELRTWPSSHCFDEQEIGALALQWAERRVHLGRASSARWPQAQWRAVARDFLRASGRLRVTQPTPGRYDDHLSSFLSLQAQGPWPSQATRKCASWQIARFLDYLDERGIALADLAVTDVDGYFQHVAQRWSRVSMCSCGKALRAWLAYCQTTGLTGQSLAQAVMLPRIYRQEGIPLGPTWEEVGVMLSQTAGSTRAQLRDNAILLLLSVYGWRSGEVRRLCLDDIDWSNDRIRVVRSKSGQQQTVPLDPGVGNAIAHYLRHGRPRSDSRIVFLTLSAPHRPLTQGGLYNLVERRFSKVCSRRKGRGPHGLRHACARRLIEAGHSLKEIGDHLGHRTPDATRIYAKIDLNSLRRAALDDLGGLS